MHNKSESIARMYAMSQRLLQIIAEMEIRKQKLLDEAK